MIIAFSLAVIGLLTSHVIKFWSVICKRKCAGGRWIVFYPDINKKKKKKKLWNAAVMFTEAMDQTSSRR
jgi:hypothetical protein